MSNAELKVTEVAGVTNQEWQARKQDAVAIAQGNIAPVYVERALGSELWDVEGKRYIDFGTGIAVCSAGHCHPKITAAVTEQLNKFSHTCVMVTPYDSSVRLAEKLNELEGHRLPPALDYGCVGGLSAELVEKLGRIRPVTLAQAARIPGVTPAALTALLFHTRPSPEPEG